MSAAAVDYMLQPYLPGVDSAPLLNRLTTMHFCRREAARYHLHPVELASLTEIAEQSAVGGGMGTAHP